MFALDGLTSSLSTRSTWLTRSLADFAKLVELFDAHQVSFVSVTQAFNTTTSMGRLTLNVLLSFAQFEREVTRQLHRCEFLEDARRRPGRRSPPPPPASRYGDRRPGHRASSQARPVLLLPLNSSTPSKQEKLQGKPRTDRLTPPRRPRHPGRTRLPAVQRLRRRFAVPSAEQALRARQRHHHHQSQLRRVGRRVRRPEDDDRATRSSHPPLPYPRNRKRQLPLQEQLGESRQTRKGETSKLDERLTPKPSSSRVSSPWNSRVKSQRKSTGPKS